MRDHDNWNQYFPKINWSTLEIADHKMLDVRNIIKNELGREVVKIFKIMKRNPRIFRIELDDDSVLRFEIIDLKLLPRIKLQEFVFLHHDGTPKIVFYKIIGNKIFKFSEWIYGKLVDEVNHNEIVNIKEPKTGLFITNGEINSTNLIWTIEEKIFIIDHDKLCTVNESGLDQMVVKNIVKRIQFKDRRDMFLKGYSEYRDIDGILKFGKKCGWTWGKRKIKPAHPGT